MYLNCNIVSLKASQASAIATLKHWSLAVKDEFSTKTILDAVSHMVIYGHRDEDEHIVRMFYAFS